MEWTQEEIKYAVDNVREKSWTEIGEELGRTPKAVMVKMSKLGYKQKEPKYDFDHHYFENIDTEEKAYWLGFIYADGWISEPYAFGIELKASDADHLKKFNKSINGNLNINFRERILKNYEKVHLMSNIRLYSRTFVLCLMSQGVTQVKSKTMLFPRIDGSLIRHFVRGYFDGDGNLRIDKRSNQLRCKFTSGSESFLEDLCSILAILKIESKIQYSNNTPELNIYGRNNTKRFLEYIYDGATIYLERKYKLYFTNRNLLDYIRKGWDR